MAARVTEGMQSASTGELPLQPEPEQSQSSLGFGWPREPKAPSQIADSPEDL
jgi:hypothetical protein